MAKINGENENGNGHRKSAWRNGVEKRKEMAKSENNNHRAWRSGNENNGGVMAAMKMKMKAGVAWRRNGHQSS
jgi:hypothetical protein